MELNEGNQHKAKSVLFKALEDLLIESPREKIYNKMKINYREKFIYKPSSVTRNQVTFIDEFESDLLGLLISPLNHPIISYHYTNLSALSSILTTGKIRLSCIVGMNDSSEITFADDALGLRQPNKKISQRRINYANDRYILSLSQNYDDLNQWRLYGDNGKGVSLEFSIEEFADEYLFPNGPFLYGNVIYDKDISDRLRATFKKIGETFGHVFTIDHIYLWRNFFKSFDYSLENEYRVIYFNSKNKYQRSDLGWSINRLGIFNSYMEFSAFTNSHPIFPFRISKIILGPRIPEYETNKMQLAYFIKKRRYKIDLLNSAIKNYRS